MGFPGSFGQSNRVALDNQCHTLHGFGLHSYQLPEVQTSHQGAKVLAKAILDESRQCRPSDWQCVGFWLSTKTPGEMTTQLQSLNQISPLKTTLEVANIARSLQRLDTHKMQRPTGQAQSFEWQVIEDIRSIPAIQAAYHDASLALVMDEGKSLITNIDDELAQLKAKKAARDERITQTQFEAFTLSANHFHHSANSAKGLAQHLQGLGDANQHWVYQLFVGDTQSLKPIQELFA
ncbi:hypothetical protein [Algicola sagamiensis]|uniref:hypothetical protein n=1 Tax=Algicola sagamiensis TaxID=163869 RepID=UPI00037C368D|nr:hypothetical protein [Algicola sagamiensis]